jgi:hypothetical protein
MVIHLVYDRDFTYEHLQIGSAMHCATMTLAKYVSFHWFSDVDVI